MFMHIARLGGLLHTGYLRNAAKTGGVTQGH
jgi:hypothetical protein